MQTRSLSDFTTVTRLETHGVGLVTEVITFMSQSLFSSVCNLLINPKNEDKFKAEFIVVKDKTLTPLLDNKAVQAMNLRTITYANINASFSTI
jgi:hypothetical protein